MREINQKHWRANHHYIYIFGKSHFLNLAKGSCGGNLRKRFELRVMAAWFNLELRRRQASVHSRLSPRQRQPLVEPCFLRVEQALLQ